MSKLSKVSEEEKMKSNLRTTIQQQEDAESLVDSIAFGPMSKLEEWNGKLQSMKEGTPETCVKARDLYNDIADGITGKRQWEENGKRVKAAKALIMSDKLDWIREKCKKPEAAALKKKRRPKKTKSKKTKHKRTKHKGNKYYKISKKHNMMGGKRKNKTKKTKKTKKRSKKR
jgi:hypothetical protein